MLIYIGHICDALITANKDILPYNGQTTSLNQQYCSLINDFMEYNIAILHCLILD